MIPKGGINGMDNNHGSCGAEKYGPEYYLGAGKEC